MRKTIITVVRLLVLLSISQPASWVSAAPIAETYQIYIPVASSQQQAVVTLEPLVWSADDDGGDDDGQAFCSDTAVALFSACRSGALDDYYQAKASCLNLENANDRAVCLAETKAARDEAGQLCSQQQAERRNICAALGEERYAPDFDPALFDSNFTRLTQPNPYFPLAIGNHWEYRGGTESIIAEVLDETKLIEGVTCIVFRDQVFDEGNLIEDTDDWFAQGKDGNVWYCGEEVKDYATFAGDKPALPELISIDGSFKAGRDGDKPGIIFQASPTPGQLYREEFSLGNAEDVTEILATAYTYGNDPELDFLVPPDLAKLLCAADCIVTKNFSAIEPGVFAYKYYAKGIGFFLEVKPEEGSFVQLVNCNFDPRCDRLPQP